MTAVVTPRPRTMPRIASPGREPVLPPRPVWMDQGACSQTDDPVFFDVHDEPKRAREADRKYCRTCPVRILCQAFALKTKSHGVWAGTTELQRRKMIRNRPRAKCPVCSCDTLITDNEHDICLACGQSWRAGRRPGNTELNSTDGDDDR